MSNYEHETRNQIKSSIKHLFAWALNLYIVINTWLGNVVIKKLASLLFGAKEDGAFIKLMDNIYIANFIYVIVLYILAQFTPYPFSMIFFYWANFNIVVICGKALTWSPTNKN